MTFDLRTKAIAAGAVIIVAIIGSNLLWSAHLKRVQEAGAQRDAYWQGRIVELANQRDAANMRTEQARAVALQKDKELVGAKAALARSPIPGPPKPPPSDLAPALASRGVATPLPQIEATTVWTWSEEAIRVPMLEAHAAAADATVLAAEGLVTAIRVENAGVRESLATADKQTAAQAERAKALQDIAAAAQKEAADQRRKKWIYAVGGLALGAWVRGQR